MVTRCMVLFILFSEAKMFVEFLKEKAELYDTDAQKQCYGLG